ncbi:MAG: hypothetical protein HYR60_19100 [Acidobacteria bacterium]|nr:hypothetical protein [Acidobacteriota bacterium]
MASATSSFRIPDHLRLRLEETARHLGKGKSWILNQALEEYLNRADRHGLVEEARRQSVLASRAASPDEAFWSRRMDRRGWR